jgi:hypothetical protein
VTPDDGIDWQVTSPRTSPSMISSGQRVERLSSSLANESVIRVGGVEGRVHFDGRAGALDPVEVAVDRGADSGTQDGWRL